MLTTGHHHDVGDTGELQCLQGIQDHRLVVDRQEMFVGDERERAQARAKPTREDHALHCYFFTLCFRHKSIWGLNTPVYRRTLSTHFLLSVYQRIVSRNASLKRYSGFQLSSFRISDASIAYRRSCPGLSPTNSISSALFPK